MSCRRRICGSPVRDPVPSDDTLKLCDMMQLSRSFKARDPGGWAMCFQCLTTDCHRSYCLVRLRGVVQQTWDVQNNVR